MIIRGIVRPQFEIICSDICYGEPVFSFDPISGNYKTSNGIVCEQISFNSFLKMIEIVK